MTRGKKYLTTKITACAGLLLFAIVTVGAKPALADDAQTAHQLVDKARLTLEAFAADSTMGPPLRNLLKRAQGVLVYPQVLRGAFIVGAGGGNGVFLVRDQKTNEWSGPAFYTMGQGSFGLQAGGDASEVVLVALTERGVNALLSTSAKLGGDVGVAVGPIGVGAEAATQNLSADIISYSRAKGLYAGASLEGAVVAPRDSLNAAFYKAGVTPHDILITRTAQNPRATQLVEALEKASGSSRVAGS